MTGATRGRMEASLGQTVATREVRTPWRPEEEVAGTVPGRGHGGEARGPKPPNAVITGIIKEALWDGVNISTSRAARVFVLMPHPVPTASR